MTIGYSVVYLSTQEEQSNIKIYKIITFHDIFKPIIKHY